MFFLSTTQEIDIKTGNSLIQIFSFFYSLEHVILKITGVMSWDLMELLWIIKKTRKFNVLVK